MLKRLLIFSTLAVMLVLSGCSPGVPQESDGQAEGTAVETATAQAGDIKTVQFFIGTLAGSGEYDILTGGPGTVERLNVKTGDRVAAGQALFSLDSASIQKTMALQASQLDTQISLYTLQVGDLEKNLQRTQTLAASGAESTSAVENAELALNQARVNLENARSNKNLTLDSLRQELTDKSIKSPVAGTVAAVYIEAGQDVQSMTAMKVVDDNGMLAVVRVTEEALSVLHTGQEALVYPNGSRENPIKGTVGSLDGVPEANSNLYRVEIILSETTGLVSGMYVEADVITEQHQDVLLIDRNVPVTVDNVLGCYVVANGKALFTPIKTGLTEGSHIEVVSGITTQSQIIIKGQDYLKHGDPVRIVSP